MAQMSGFQLAAMRQGMKVAVWLYRLTGGAIGGKMKGSPVLLLSTTGRKSGQTRTRPLVYQRDGERIVVIASFAGSDKHPAWFVNLRSTPKAVVELGRERIEVTASEAEGAERERLWAMMATAYPDYNTYLTRTSRTIPVVVLEPAQPA